MGNETKKVICEAIELARSYGAMADSMLAGYSGTHEAMIQEHTLKIIDNRLQETNSLLRAIALALADDA